GGPNFRATPPQPYWFGPDRALLEIPMTVEEIGSLAPIRRFVSPAIRHPTLMRLRAPGVFARLGLLERITLTPEGITLEEMKRLTRGLLAEGRRSFTLSYHSSTLLPGSTPYVASQADLSAFIEKIDRFLEFFLGELGGVAITPSEFHRRAWEQRNAANADIEPVQRKRA
ncbi:MAG: glycosyltransferase, partial [Alphaproteobacteria bacterium]|nr:glycosyltransferase [Alphaproteobacteria bacterium]